MTTSTASQPAFLFHPKLWAAAALLLALPAAAMIMTKEVNWDAQDFAVFAVMLTVLCAALEGAWNWLTLPRWRVGSALFAVLLFLTVWVHLAVGIFD